MNKIERFEDLLAWRETRVLTRRIYGCAKTTALTHDFSMKDQLQRAAISVMSNLLTGLMGSISRRLEN